MGGGKGDLPSNHAQQETYEQHVQHQEVIDIGDRWVESWERMVFFVDGIEVKLHPSTKCSLDMTKEGVGEGSTVLAFGVRDKMKSKETHTVCF